MRVRWYKTSINPQVVEGSEYFGCQNPAKGAMRTALSTMQIPSAYTEGYAKARVHDPALADLYVEHTGIGDPVLDPVMEEIASLPNDKLTRFIRAGITQEEGGLNGAPQALRNFFQRVDTETPPWLDHEAFRPAIRVFNLNVTNMLIAFVCGVLIEGFATLITKSFFATGRVTGPENGEKTPHAEQPPVAGGLLSRRPPERRRWIQALFARPLRSRPHQAPARALRQLGPRALGHTDKRGAPRFRADRLFHAPVAVLGVGGYQFQRGRAGERHGCMALYRLRHGTSPKPSSTPRQRRREKIFDIAYMCEPPPDADCAATANALITAIPVTASIEDPREAESVKALAYRISRALIGDDLADALHFPRDEHDGNAVRLADETALSAPHQEQATAPITEFHPTSRNLRVRRGRAELPAAGPRGISEIQSLVIR